VDAEKVENKTGNVWHKKSPNLDWGDDSVQGEENFKSRSS
jgi:hypothetical protein